MTILTAFQFETVVKTIHNNLDHSFNAKKAEAFGITLKDDLSVKITPIAADGDVYDLLEYNEDLKEGVKSYDAITIATCGWAAPINKEKDADNETAPSQHPDKRRVKLCITANVNKQMGSVISFQDDPDNSVYDFGDARGSLAEAIANIFSNAEQ